MVVSPEGGSVDTGATVVVGVDGTDLSIEALERTVRFAKAVSARVVVCYVHHLDIPMSDPATGVAAVVVLEGAEDELASVAEKAANAVLQDSGLDWEFVARQGEPAHEMIEVAHETNASWIVVGASIHGVISGFLLSSVASQLLHHSDVSVAVVRPPRSVTTAN